MRNFFCELEEQQSRQQARLNDEADAVKQAEQQDAAEQQIKDIANSMISMHDWLILWETSVLRACVSRAAGLRHRDSEIMAPEQISARPQHVHDEWVGGHDHVIPQVIVTV